MKRTILMGAALCVGSMSWAAEVPPGNWEEDGVTTDAQFYYLAMPGSAEDEEGIGLMVYDWQKSDDQQDPVASWLSANENKSIYTEVMFEESDSVGKGTADQLEGPVPGSSIMVRDLFESDEFPLVSSLVACRADSHYRAMEFVFPAMQLDDADMASWTEDSVNSVVRWACDKAALQAALAATAESAKAAEAQASEQTRIASANAESARPSASTSAGKSAGTMDWLSRGCWHQKSVVGEAVKTRYMCFSNDGAVNFSRDTNFAVITTDSDDVDSGIVSYGSSKGPQARYRLGDSVIFIDYADGRGEQGPLPFHVEAEDPAKVRYQSYYLEIDGDGYLREK